MIGDENGAVRLNGQLKQALADLLELNSDGLVVVDRRGEMVLVNRRTVEMFGYARHELVGQHVEILIPGAQAKRHIMERGAYFSSPHLRRMGVGLDTWGLRKDGAQFPVEIALAPLETAEGLFAAAMIRDLAETVMHNVRLMQLLSEVADELGVFLGSRRAPVDKSLLTARELEVLALASQGLSAREISARLTVSPSTVKTHLEHIYEKLGATDRAAAVASALRAGILK